MARKFDDGASQYLEIASVPVSAAPLSMSLWFNTDDDAIAQFALTIVDSATEGDWFAISLNGNAVGDPIRAWARQGGGSQYAESTTGYSANTWHHACGVFASSTARAVYLDGGSKGTNAEAGAPASLDTVSIGRVSDFSPGGYVSGRIALPVIWKGEALTDGEVARLPYEPPWNIRPWALKMMVPFRFNRTWDRDIAGRGGFHMTPVNGPTWADDPPVVRKMWHDWEMLRRKRRWPVQNKPIYTAEIVWGHDTGVLETTVRDLQHNWDGTGEVVNPGVADTEAMELASGEYMIGEITYTGAVDIEILYNVYVAGDNINLDYRHGATPAACEAAGWNNYVAAFTSAGYVQARVTGT